MTYQLLVQEWFWKGLGSTQQNICYPRSEDENHR